MITHRTKVRYYEAVYCKERREPMENEKQRLKILADLPIRQQNLAKYIPFAELYALNKRSDKYTNLDMGVLVLSVLSYLLYEGHLKDRGVGFEEIQGHLEGVIGTVYNEDYSPVEMTDLTRYVLDKLQNGGTPFDYTYYDLEERRMKETKLRYISYTRDALLEKNFYRLTTVGIDFLLQTKEFGEESKISIQLILLRKLVEHEDFGSALSTLERINIEIKKEAKRKGEILEELSYGFTEGYALYTQSVRKRLEDEQSLFKETLSYLSTLEKEYLQQIEASQMSEKDLRFKRFVIDMQMELSKTVELHALLLDALVDLRQKAEEMLVARRKTIFKENFNFHHFLENAIRKDDTRGLAAAMNSLFDIHLPKQFALERIDHLFLLKEEKNSEGEIVNPEDSESIKVETLDQQVTSRLIFNYELMFRELLFLVMEKEHMSLSDYLQTLKARYGSQVVENYDLPSFMMILTQTKGEESGTKCFDYRQIIRQETKLPSVEAIYKKIVTETESLSIFKEVNLIVEVQRGTYMTDGALEMTDCHYYIKR